MTDPYRDTRWSLLKQRLPFPWRKRLHKEAMDEVNAGFQVEPTGGLQKEK